MRMALLAMTVATLSGAATAAEPASTAATGASGDRDRIVCRKTLETGSLVKKNKQCFTLAEWDRIYAANREGNEKTRAQLSSGYNCEATGTC